MVSLVQYSLLQLHGRSISQEIIAFLSRGYYQASALHFTNAQVQQTRIRRDNVSITSTLSLPSREKKDHTPPVQNECRSTTKWTPDRTPTFTARYSTFSPLLSLSPHHQPTPPQDKDIKVYRKLSHDIIPQVEKQQRRV